MASEITEKATGMSEKGEGDSVQHIFIIRAKSIGQYGDCETFADKLTEHPISYILACSVGLFINGLVSYRWYMHAQPR